MKPSVGTSDYGRLQESPQPQPHALYAAAPNGNGYLGGPSNEFQAATNDVSRVTQIRLITWKNFKTQVVRRKCSCYCKMCCPLTFMLIMGIYGLLRPLMTFPTNCYNIDYNNNQCLDDMYILQNDNYDLLDENNIYPIDIIPNLVCMDGSISPPRSIGIVYDEANSQLAQRVNGIMDIIYNNYAKQTPAPTSFTDCYSVATDISISNWTNNSLLHYFPNQGKLESYIRSDHYGMAGYNIENNAENGALRPLAAAIVFKSVSNDGKIWDYTLRFNQSSVPATFSSNEYQTVDVVDKDAYTLYYNSIGPYSYSSFMGLQSMIDIAITQYIATEVNDVTINITKYLQDYKKGYFIFPFAPYPQDNYWDTWRYPFVAVSAIMFIYPIIQIISVLVIEKSKKIKEGMKMMGATPTTYWSSMYLWFAGEFTLICLIVCLIGFGMDVFIYSDKLILFIWFWLFCMSQMTFSTLISSLFDDSKTAIIVGLVLYFVFVGIGIAGMENMNETQKQLMSFMAVPCFIQSVNNVIQYENSLIGIQWDNLSETVSQFSMETALLMLFIDAILYLLLTLYFDNVLPSRYGQKLSPIFCLTPTFWKSVCNANKKDNEDGNKSAADLKKLGKLHHYEDIAKIQNLKYDDPVIKVRELSKVFNANGFGRNNKVRAVNGVSLDIYSGEVFCLLGHNGAGKTTTISMLSGLLASTDGDAYINGYNVGSDMNKIRKFLGVCPQHDVLWDLLTAAEHLRFFARLKGVKSDRIEYELNRIINLFDMIDNGLWGKYPPNMSGGEKRRLSLAISLIGGSNVVFLDEPTSGMDPENRRKVWDIIQQEKKNRCIILTTHYMDEADILGDRIAIMSAGKIKCCGSSLYLKRLYGVGYTFTVSLKSGVNLEEQQDEEKHAGDSDIKPKIDGIITEIDGAKTVSVAASEILYRLPFESSGQFSNIFKKLDERSEELRIETFGVSVTTLEEVFLKIENQETATQSMSMMSKNGHQDDTENISIAPEQIKFEQPDFQLEHRNNCWIFIIHIYAILYKRFWWSIRDVKGIMCQIILPAALIALVFGININVTQIDQKELQLSPQQFTPQYTNNIITPISTLQSGYNYGSVNNLYYTEGDWPSFWVNNMESAGFGHNFTFSIGNASSYCFEYNQVWDNCAEYFQRQIFKYQHYGKGNTPYYGFYFLPWTNTVLLGVNASAYHSLPIAYNAWNNWVLRNKFDPNTQSAKINLYSNPLPITKLEQTENSILTPTTFAMFLVIAFTLIPAASIFFVVNEKSIGTKHQQFVSGISISSYWIGTYLSDILLGLPTSAMVIALIYIFDVNELKGDAIMPLFATLMLFVSSSISAGYLLHFFFKSAGKAQFVTILCNIMFGVILSVVLISINFGPKGETAKQVFRTLPVFLLAENAYNILSNSTSSDMWSDDLTRNVWFMAFESVGYFGLVLIIEYAKSFPGLLAKLGFVVDQPRKFMRLDDDVLNEQMRIRQAINPQTGEYIENSLDDTVILSGLRKVYKGENKFSAPKAAVRDMYFGVKQGEVFGFLGTNGAGKTSTLNMLTGQIYPSSGIAYIAGKSVVSEQLAIRRNIGFCPQNDAIFDLLTAREHLKFYALIKGLNGKKTLDKEIDTLLTALTLHKYSKRTANTYSGGNKRKLCVAQAMIGNPPVIFMDEPSTGMDPVSRRFMWKFINQTMNGRAVILTTHSMEECEALCNRVGIMVAGQLSCIGSPQYLKSKFGKGYQLDITLSDELDEAEEKYNNNNRNIIHSLLEEFNKTFPTTILQQNGRKILLEIREFEVNDGESKLSALGKMFKFVEEMKGKYNILSYALSQTSLEQVFLKMAAQKGVIEGEAQINSDQAELLKIIQSETKEELINRISLLNRDRLQDFLENEIKNGSLYVVRALKNDQQQVHIQRSGSINQ